MNWSTLHTEEQLQNLIKASYTRPQVIFKHSTRCYISARVLKDFEEEPVAEGVDFHFLDLLANRALSNKIANDWQVRHQSPQVLLIKNGECIYHTSHADISMEDIKALQRA
ncbi:MAG: bacillithiol system redox-active protein YtxJ [Chitinophagaceae bacterium]|nr:bacillithiol system redox-active protein YtxJ [Chitinophagaceae bacterium]HQU56033.1 bacillithiol system redox-active protein YtxJ [Chitinophagaceae bacterium]HQV05354.1 bacillithiol system redox-active protein YtxJ [Chitinophagaceae bacterium]